LSFEVRFDVAEINSGSFDSAVGAGYAAP
jgi:hypothetical protein